MIGLLGQLAAAALKSYFRIKTLTDQIDDLKVQIDEAKKERQVTEITESDYFKDLQTRAREMRTKVKGQISTNHRGQNRIDSLLPRGTGKSNLTANLASLVALEGNRVAVVDTDIQSPGIHVPFGLRGAHGARAQPFYLGRMPH